MVKLNEKVDELKKKLILDTASEYFKTLGYEKTQIDKISKELSIGVGTIYGYFNSKEGLFMAWFKRLIENAYSEMKEHCEISSSPVEKLALIIDYKIKYFQKNKMIIQGYMENNRFFMRGISSRKEHPMEKVYNYCADIIKEIRPMANEEAYLLANIFDAIINSYIECSLNFEELIYKKEEIFKRFMCVVGI